MTMICLSVMQKRIVFAHQSCFLKKCGADERRFKWIASLARIGNCHLIPPHQNMKQAAIITIAITGYYGVEGLLVLRYFSDRSNGHRHSSQLTAAGLKSCGTFGVRGRNGCGKREVEKSSQTHRSPEGLGRVHITISQQEF